MKKVAILVSTLKIGGAEKQSVYLFNALKKNYETSFIVFHGDMIDNRNIQLIEGNNYKIIRLHGNLLYKLFFLYEFLNSNRITHLFTYLTKPNFWGSLIARIAGVNNTYTNIRTTTLPPWKIMLEKIASLGAKGIIFNSYSGATIFEKKGFKNSIFIPNCFVNVSEPLVRTKNEEIKIITVGRFVEEKDYFTSLKALRILRDMAVKFIYQIVGYGQLEQRLREEVIELGLSQHVEIIIKPNNIDELLNKADIYLSTSLFEGTSNSIMEAMNASLPVVATNVGDNNNLVWEGVNGFLNDVGDYVSLSRSIEKLATCYDLRKMYGLKSNEILRKKNSFYKFQQNYFNLINKS